MTKTNHARRNHEQRMRSHDPERILPRTSRQELNDRRAELMNLEAKTMNAVLQFGKYKGRTLAEVHADDPSYLRWLVTTDLGARKYGRLLKSLS